jgi:hypothetical protein
MSTRLCVSVSLLMSAVLLLATSAIGASIEGRWSGPQGTAVYTQDGNAVAGEGTLPNGETAKIVGVMIGNKVYYSYVRSTGPFGTGTMTLSEDGSRLESTYAELGTGNSGTWQLTRDAAGGSPPAAKVQLAGRWNSNLGEVVFEQSDTSATAKITMVDSHTASITGEIRGRKLDFTFRLDEGGGGNGQLTLSDDGMILSGTYKKVPDIEKGEWILVRPGPVPCGELKLPAAQK